MKFRLLNIIPLLLIIGLLCSACGTGSDTASVGEASQGPSITIQNVPGSPSVTVPSVSVQPVPSADPSAAPDPLPTVQLAPIPTAPPSPTPTPKPSIGPYYPPTVKKSPLGEDCIEGSTIYFTAFADNCLRYDWQLEKDHVILNWADMAETFPGMKVAGINSSYLVLANVPIELDGWSVHCIFTGSGEAAVYSRSAMIHVSERTLKIHGKDRKTVKGTGNVSGFKAVIDYEGELWWVVEEYAGQTFSLRKNDTDPELGIKDVRFSIYEDGSVLIVIDGTEYRGTVDEERLGGYSASAKVTKDGSDEEMPVFFDYTADSQRWENWNQIYLDIMLEFPVVPDEPEESPEEEQPAAEEAPAEEAAPAGSFSDEPDAAGEAPAEEPQPETEFRAVRFILTRVR
ncbi:MAG: hypothetical protein IJH53_05730 [Oscillospiraceae bacterium]|nr:hypothetical protein [Oscillospiraceae bacterium]